MVDSEPQTRYIPLQCDSIDPTSTKISDLYKSTETNLHFGQPTRGGKLIEPKLTALQLWRFSLINMYVTDALNTRAPNKVIQSRQPRSGLFGISIHTAYQMSHNSFWSILVYGSIWLHLSLISYEPFANINMTNDYPIWLYLIEAVILLIYSIDVYLHYISHDPENYWDLSWAKIIVACIVLNTLDILGSIIIHTFLIDGFLLRFGAILRPIFLVTRSQFLRATLRSVFNSIGRVLDVLILVCLYILMFAVLGYVLFSQNQLGIGVHVEVPNAFCDETAAAGNAYDTDCNNVQQAGNVNFDTLYNSYLSLCVLMSTANYPDVMMPSFHSNKYSGIYFAAFIAFGIYYLMSIIFAVIYHHYHGDNARFVAKMTNNRARALDEAFKQLIIFSKELENPNYELDPSKVYELDFNAEKIYFPLFRRYIQFRRKKISVSKVRVLYNAMSEASARTEAVKLYEDEGIGITREQWQNLYKFVNVEIFRDPSYAVEYMLKKGQNDVMFSLILGDENMYSMDGGCCQKCFIDRRTSVIGDRKNECCFQLSQKIYFMWLRFRGLLYRLFTHYIVSRIIDLLVWIGTLVLIYEISQKNYDPTLDKISDILIYVFVIEVTLRLIAFGKYFFRDGFNVLDFIVVYASLFADMFDINGNWTGRVTDNYGTQQIGQEQRSNGIVAFRLLRFIRALGTIERFKLIISTSVTVLKKVGVLFSLEFCVFYVFAVIGVFCYGGIVTKESSLSMLYRAIQENDVDDTRFWQYVRDNYYYDNNMNQISNTLMVMVELTVVNQWHAITQMYTQLTSPWTYLYFYSFYFVSVLIVTNVLTAFIFDAFIIQFQTAQTDQDELRRKKARQQRVEQIKQIQKERKIEKQTKKNQLKQKQKQRQKQRQKKKNNKRISIQNFMSDQPIISSMDYSAENLLLNDDFDPNRSGFSDKLSDYGQTMDVLDEYINELNVSEKEDWHKWIAIAMLYEFDTDDVIKGVWLYDRKKTTADFYEQIYGEVHKPFNQYLFEWGEQIKQYDDDDEEYQEYQDNEENEENEENDDLELSMNGVSAQETSRNDTLRSAADSAATFHSNSIRGKGKDIFITRTAIKARSIFDGRKTVAMTVQDNDGNIDQVSIKGPKQNSIFSALSTAPQVGFAPQVNKEQANKVSKLLDYYQPPKT